VVVYNIYRRQVGGGSEDKGTVIARTFGRTGLLKKDSSYSYMDNRGKIDSILCSNEDQVIDTVNDRTSQTFNYGISSVTALQPGSGGVYLAGGFINSTTYATQIFASKQPNFMVIKNGAVSTATRGVAVTGRIDMEGVDTIYYYRFSSILPMDTLNTWLIRIGDSSNLGRPFLNKRSGTAYAEYLSVNADSTITLKVSELLSDGTYKIGYFAFGKLGRLDILSKASFALQCDSFTVDQQGLATFTRKDTLVSGPGRKWVMLRAASSNGAKVWSPISDDISIARYSDASINVDHKSSAGGIPFVLSTFGDTTFSDTVVVWMATRNLSASFMDAKGGIGGGAVTAYYLDSTRTFPDAILETPPQTFPINTYGIATGSLTVNYESGFRVSPMAYRSEAGAVSLDVGTLSRAATDPAGLALSVKPGSILGYQTSRLDAFLDDQEIGKDSVYTYIGVKGVIASPGWHQAGIAPTKKRSSAEYFLSYDSVWYLNPMNYLPVNVASVDSGTKEFVLVAYTTGKYFGEPRVFISRFSSSVLNLWDKMPPHITWSITADPFTPGGVYAPSLLTNLTLVNKVFDVYLDPEPTDIQLMAGIRDAGFGRIKSATLHFHYFDRSKPRSQQYTADPLTGERTYADGSKDKEYPLDPVQLEQQQYSGFIKDQKALLRRSYAIGRAAYQGIDARQWQSGLWDMWMVTEDDLGNKGIAPFGGMKIDAPSGAFISRQIEIK
jgi:hypothetical protein